VTSGGEPDVSVIVPTFNRRDQLTRTLEGLAAQDFPRRRFEVVVVSDGSSDGTDELLAAGDTPIPVVAVRQPNSGPAAARNHGVDEARGTLVVFIDDDIVPDPHLLSEHVAAHESLDDDLVVIGPMLDPVDHEMSPWVQWEQRMLYKQYAAMQAGEYDATPRQFYTGNASVARRHLLAERFDPSFRRAEDIELAYRLADRGLRFAFHPGAIAYHYASRSYDAWRHNASVYGRNDVVFARDHGRAWILEAIGREFGERHRALQIVIRGALRYPWLRGPIDLGLRVAAGVAGRVGLDRVAQNALSGIYGVEYHRGVSEELGGVDRFDALLQRQSGRAA
jgi:glycosyltransferase involved in cell wall biosynthesis